MGSGEPEIGNCLGLGGRVQQSSLVGGGSFVVEGIYENRALSDTVPPKLGIPWRPINDCHACPLGFGWMGHA